MLMALVVRVQITRYAVMGRGVGAVRSDIHFDGRVILHVVILAGGHAYRSVRRQHDDTCVVGSYADLVFGTNHTERVLAAQLAFLNGKTLVAVIEHGADGGDNHFLSRRYVGRTANNLQGLSLADIHGCQMQMVGIRVGNAG